jgi:leucyl-tRNA synthetase
MSRTDERYNSMDAEARWQAAWRNHPWSPIATMGISDGTATAPPTLETARAAVVADAVARRRRARGISATVGAIPGLARLGVVASAFSGVERGRLVSRLEGVEAGTPACLLIGPVTGADLPDPIDLAACYGADSVRLQLLSDVAPDRPLAWNDGGTEGAWRYCHRLWRLGMALIDIPSGGSSPASIDGDALRQEIDRAIIFVTAEIDGFRWHTAIARLRSLSHRLAAAAALQGDVATTARDGFAILLRLFAPVLPHLCEELAQRLGEAGPLFGSDWPRPSRLNREAAATTTIAVQVDGRHRAVLRLPAGVDRNTLERTAMAHPAVAYHLRGRTPRHVIVVPNRILNVVL